MRVIRDCRYCPEIARGGLLAIGNFDSLHLGHKYLLKKAKELADTKGIKFNVMTFDPHPSEFFNESEGCIAITHMREKLEMLEEVGVDFVFLQKFDSEFSKKTPKIFISEIVEYLQLKHLFVGESFYFGYNKDGDFSTIQDAAKEYSFGFSISPMLKFENGSTISSSSVRTCLLKGDIEQASKMLGYHYFISGQVVDGRKVGNKIGFPTINLQYERRFMPKTGVYTASIYIEGDNCKYYGFANIELDKEEIPSLKMHILNFHDHVIGKNVKIMLHQYIRGQKLYSSIKDIASQSSKDKIKAQQYFESLNA
jgi:riboflavin kinase/FMN adenylyltransferase